MFRIFTARQIITVKVSRQVVSKKSTAGADLRILRGGGYGQEFVKGGGVLEKNSKFSESAAD